MCGIFGYIGQSPALRTTLNGLAKLEYRGYDSAGVAYFYEQKLNCKRTTDKIASLIEELGSLEDDGAAIAHTRWATHGEVSLRNAHPQQAGRVTLVHNGIIENYRDILSQMPQKPVSDTDTEAAALLIDHFYEGDPVSAISQAVAKLKGAYAFAILFSDRPSTLYAVHRESPLTILEGETGSFLSSDPAAFAEYGRNYLVPAEDVVAELSAKGVIVHGAKESLTLGETDAFQDKGAYEHYMLKEIYEQPQALWETISRNLSGSHADCCAHADPALFQNVDALHIIGCGTAMHAGCTAAAYLDAVTAIPVQVHIASEFVSGTVRIENNALYLFISQSGETADTLAAIRAVKEQNGRMLAILNKHGTTIEREVGNVVYTYAGPEVAVASTKAFTAQVAALYLIGIRLGRENGTLSDSGEARELAALQRVPGQVNATFSLQPAAHALSQRLGNVHSLFYLGRGVDYALAREGALKIKEISYLHAEAIAAGEMKHGVISLICPGTPGILFLTQSNLRDKILLSAREMATRGGKVTFIVTDDLAQEASTCGGILRLPVESGPYAVFSASIALQFLAYETARFLGRPIDQPRNLAKSVTVS